MTYHLWAITSSASAWSKTQAWFSTLCSNLNVACVSQFRAMLECYQLLEYHSLTCDAEVSGHCKCMFMCFPLQQGFSTQCYWHFGLDIFVFRSFPVYHRKFSSTLASHQMPGSFPCLWQPKMFPDVVKLPPEGGGWTVKLPCPRTSEKVSRFQNIRKIRFSTQRQNDDYNLLPKCCLGQTNHPCL